MIRTIQRRLIIPRGDTGSFSVPLNAAMSQGDIAIFSLFDPLTRKNVLELQGEIENDTITFNFSRENTIDLAPRKYLWDVVLYHDPVYDEDNKIVNGGSIDSYYAAFKLPVCEIREVAQDV